MFSVTPDAIDSLVDLLLEAPSLQDTTVWDPPVRIMDGPVFTQEVIQNSVWVGMDDPDSDQAPIGAETERQYAGLGVRRRNEQSTIHCVAECWSGSKEPGTLRLMRRKAYNLVAAVEAIVLADATLGGVLPSGWAEVGGMQLHQNQVEEGAVARVSFHVAYHAQLDGS